MSAMIDWFQNQWWWVQTLGFGGQLVAALCAVGAIIYLLAEPAQTSGLAAGLLCALFGYANWGFWGTLGGVVVGAVVGGLVFAAIHDAKEQREKRWQEEMEARRQNQRAA